MNGTETAFWEVALNRQPETGSLAAEFTLATIRLTPMAWGNDRPSEVSLFFVTSFVQPIRPFQNLAGPAAIGRADDAVFMHHVENARGAPVT